MECKLLILAGLAAIVSSITVSSNGNTPERKMVSGMMIDAQKGMNLVEVEEMKSNLKSNYEKSRKIQLSPTKLSLNERHRRLIPYMTFYYANDLISPSTKPYSTNGVEVQKAQIEQNAVHIRNSKKENYNPNYFSIPRYKENRITKYNIAPTNLRSFTTYVLPTTQKPLGHDALYIEQNFMNGHTFGRHNPKYVPGSSSEGFTQTQNYQVRKPTQNLYHTDPPPGIQYYVPEKQTQQKYKLVPYEQTSLVRFTTPPMQYNQKQNIAVPVLTSQDNHVYVKSRPKIPSISNDDADVQPHSSQLHTYPKTETYYERSPKPLYYDATPKIPEPESGFMPMLPLPIHPSANEAVSFITTTPASPQVPVRTLHDSIRIQSPRPVYKQSIFQPEHYPRPSLAPEQPDYKYSSTDSATLSDILATLQRSQSIPQPITKENVGSSIRTLLRVLNELKANSPQHNEVERLVHSTPKPFVATPKTIDLSETSDDVHGLPSAPAGPTGLNEYAYLKPVNTPSQHLDDYRGTSQAFPLAIASEDDGGTPGRAGIDYPTLTTIPETSFDCKTQRYKGFFADPETKCQVWHYCDLNGGQASFLCPNGTIFSQAALTCDWWFNVKCDSTHQLYVLNERLYKYILPHQPKFPEDYSGPIVDRYLTIKFKEMEEQFRRNKNKTPSSIAGNDDADPEDEEIELEAGTEAPTDGSNFSTEPIAVSEASVMVQSSGDSGNVQHLE